MNKLLKRTGMIYVSLKYIEKAFRFNDVSSREKENEDHD